jgi:hypothetical protein
MFVYMCVCVCVCVVDVSKPTLQVCLKSDPKFRETDTQQKYRVFSRYRHMQWMDTHTHTQNTICDSHKAACKLAANMPQQRASSDSEYVWSNNF